MPWHNDPPPSLFRSGFVAVVGRPNVGKSTLLNAILGQKIAIVSPKPQTTRRKQLGIYTTEHVQIIFVDTPGILRPRHSLDKFMIGTAYDALDDADDSLKKDKEIVLEAVKQWGFVLEYADDSLKNDPDILAAVNKKK